MREPKSSTVSGLIPDGHANRKENTETTLKKELQRNSAVRVVSRSGQTPEADSNHGCKVIM